MTEAQTPDVLTTYNLIFHVLRQNGFRVGTVRRDGTVRANRDVLSLATATLRNIEVIVQADGQAHLVVRQGQGTRGKIITQGSGKAGSPTDDLSEVAATAIATAIRLA